MLAGGSHSAVLQKTPARFDWSSCTVLRQTTPVDAEADRQIVRRIRAQDIYVLMFLALLGACSEDGICVTHGVALERWC